MALQAKAIKQKMKGVGNIKKITRTMEMVSVSKMKKANTAAALVREYNNELMAILEHISQKSRTDHHYFSKQKNDKKCIVIISSNKGLAGSYNTNLYKKVLQFVRENKISLAEVESITVGKQAEKISKRAGIPVVASFVHIPDTPDISDGEMLFSSINNFWSQKKYSEIFVVSTHFVKPGVFQPESKQLLPLMYDNHVDEKTAALLHKETLFEPSESAILDTVVPRLLSVHMYSVLAFAAACEHSSRMFAMKTASDNATELQRVLTISYNKARQDAVTQELAEIAAGSL